MLQDCYSLLGVPKHSLFPEIQAKYRQAMADSTHEKAVATSEAEQRLIIERMKQLSEAFNLLKDPVTRAILDRSGSDIFPTQKTLNEREIIRIIDRQSAEG
jgi:DnaJ-class molecular chaperone